MPSQKAEIISASLEVKAVSISDKAILYPWYGVGIYMFVAYLLKDLCKELGVTGIIHFSKEFYKELQVLFPF